MTHAAVPVLCAPGATVVCIASGPSLTDVDVELCRGRVDAAIVVNRSFKKAPWATALYAADAIFWDDYPDAHAFQGLKYSIDSQKTPNWRAKFPNVQILKNTGDHGLELVPTGLRTGKNSGYQSIGLAVHALGRQPGRIILLGFDMQLGPKGQAHWHDNHPHHRRSNYLSWLPAFRTLVRPLRELGIDIVNCSRRTALTAFPQMALEEALSVRTELAS